MNGRRLFVTRRGDDGLHAVCLDDDELIYGGWRRMHTVARELNAWQPTDEQLATWLHWQSEEGRAYIEGMRRITLRFPATCVRCSQTIDAGARASWDPETKLVVHGLRCPLRTRKQAA